MNHSTPTEPVAAERFGPVDVAVAAGFMTYSASTVLTPIALVLIARDLGLSLSEASVIEVIRSTLVLGVLVISGFLAAHFGKPRALGLSYVLLGLGLVCYAMAPGYGALLLAATLIGAGAGVAEALLNPLVQDAHPQASGRYLNISNGFWSIGVVGMVLLSGDLLTRGVPWRWIAAVLGIVTLVSGLGFFAVHSHVPRPVHRVRDVWGHLGETLRRRRFWLFAPMMFAGGAAEGAFTFWSASFIQLHHGGLPRAGGFGTACFAGGMIVGRFASGWGVGQHHLWRLILGSAIGGLAVSMLVPIAGSLPAVYAVLGLAGLAVACFWPSLQSYAADRMTVDTTALFILLSVAGIPGFAFASWIMGVVGDLHGLAASFAIVPAFFAALIVLLLIERQPWRRARRATDAG